MEEYYLAKKAQLQSQLNNNWLNSAGMDISHIYRGKIAMIDEFLQTAKVFENYDKLETELKKEEEKQKGAK